MSVKQTTSTSLPKLLHLLQGPGAPPWQHKGPSGRWVGHFYRHLWRFLKQQHLFQHQNVLVSVSGGADSMGLLSLAWLFKQQGQIQSLEALHINHGTRQACKDEEALVRSYCQQLNIPLQVHSLKMDFGGNFEALARRERYRLYQEKVRKDQVIWQGHHADDSFEWWLMQRLKTSSSTMGIPLKNGNVIRPWMAASRLQIRQWCRLLSVPFLEDESNRNVAFERNFVRHQMQGLLFRFPSYLKHYCRRANQWAIDNKRSVLSLQLPLVHFTRDQLGNGCFFTADGSNNFSRGRESIINYIVSLEGLKRDERSKLSNTLEQLFLCASRGQSLGPIYFSAGIKAYLAPGRLGFFTQSGLDKVEKYDRPNQSLKDVFPFITPSAGKKGKHYSRIYPLWPVACGVLSKKQQQWTYISLNATRQKVEK